MAVCTIRSAQMCPHRRRVSGVAYSHVDADEVISVKPAAWARTAATPGVGLAAVAPVCLSVQTQPFVEHGVWQVARHGPVIGVCGCGEALTHPAHFTQRPGRVYDVLKHLWAWTTSNSSSA